MLLQTGATISKQNVMSGKNFRVLQTLVGALELTGLLGSLAMGETGDHQRAEHHWRAFLGLAPDSPWAEEARSRLDQQQ